MNFNFYTTFENAKLIKEGQKAEVWSKAESRSFDVHITFDYDMYLIEKITNHIYSVEKKEQNEAETLVIKNNNIINSEGRRK